MIRPRKPALTPEHEQEFERIGIGIEVDWNHFALLGFLERLGFRPHRRLALRRVVG